MTIARRVLRGGTLRPPRQDYSVVDFNDLNDLIDEINIAAPFNFLTDAVGDGVTDDTAVLQAAFTAGGWIKGDPSKTYRITSRLIVSASNLIVEDVHFYGPASAFTNTVKATRYGTAGCFVLVQGLQVSPFTAIENITFRNCKFESQVSAGRYLTGLVFSNCNELLVQGCEFWGFPVARLLVFNSCGKWRALRNDLHDCVDAGSGLVDVQTTAIDVDDDRVNSVNSDYFQIAFNQVRTVTAAGYSFQSDGININGNGGSHWVIEGNVIDDVGDGIDVFGSAGVTTGDCVIGHNQISRIHGDAVKLIHGASNILVTGNRIRKAGRYGIGVYSSNSIGDVQDIALIGNSISEIDPDGVWVATGTAPIALDGTGNTYKIRSCTVSGNYLDPGANGKYALRRINDGDKNNYIANVYKAAGTLGTVQDGTETNSFHVSATELAGLRLQNNFINQMTVRHDNAGGASNVLGVINSSVSASTEATLGLLPTTAGFTRGAHVSAVQEGSDVIRGELRGSGTASAPVQQLAWRDGVKVGSPTGSFPGAGKLNAVEVQDDSVVLTCFLLREEFLKHRRIDLAYWDNKYPPLIEPARVERVPLTTMVKIRTQVLDPDLGGFVEREVDQIAPATELFPLFDQEGRGIDAIDRPAYDEIEIPERITPRRHEVAHLAQAMIDDGFDPTKPGAYIARMIASGALPGMPTEGEWQHNTMSVGTMICRLWLAMEFMALAFMGVEERVAALEAK